MFRQIIFSGLIALAAGCSQQDTLAPEELAGSWESRPISLSHGDFNETYLFKVEIDSNLTGQMDITYWVDNQPEEKRTLRQTIALTDNVTGDQVILTGADPVLVSGPEFVGVYEPDQLTCIPFKPQILDCNWGSNGHGQPVIVSMTKRPG